MLWRALVVLVVKAVLDAVLIVWRETTYHHFTTEYRKQF